MRLLKSRYQKLLTRTLLFSRKGVSLFLASLFFISQTLLAYQPEKAFWENRNNAIQEKNKKEFQVAATLPLPGLSPLPQTQLGSHANPNASGAKNDKTPLTQILKNTPARLGKVRDVVLPSGPSKGTVLFIQDIHGHSEAQNHIAEMLSWAHENTSLRTVALEGTNEQLPRTNLLTFPDKTALLETASDMMDHSLIAGSILGYLLAGDKNLTLSGIEDLDLYQKNVNALRATRREGLAFKDHLKKESLALENKKANEFSKALKDLDAIFTEYHAGRLDMGPAALQINELLSRSFPNKAAHFPSFSHFTRTVEIENKLNFENADKERTQFFQALLEKLSHGQSSQLLDWAASHRLGGLSLESFHARVFDLAEEAGLVQNQFPNFALYNTYLQEMEKINGEHLLEEMIQIEAFLFQKLSQSPTQKALSREVLHHRMVEKLSALALTSAEWTQFKKSFIAENQKRPGLQPFIDFYVAAEKRDNAMAQRMLTLLKSDPNAILVSGGFHAEGITRHLSSEGYTVAHFIPRVESVDAHDPDEYFSLFEQDQVPVGRLFKGQKLFLAFHPLSASAEYNLATRSAGPESAEWLSENLTTGFDSPFKDDSGEKGPFKYESNGLNNSNLVALYLTFILFTLVRPFDLAFSPGMLLALTTILGLSFYIPYRATKIVLPIAASLTLFSAYPALVLAAIPTWLWIRLGLLVSVGTHEAGHTVADRRFNWRSPFSSFLASFNVRNWGRALVSGSELQNAAHYSAETDPSRVQAITLGGWVGYWPTIILGSLATILSGFAAPGLLASEILLVAGLSLVMSGLFVVLINIGNKENLSYFTGQPPQSQIYGLMGTKFNSTRPVWVEVAGGRASAFFKKTAGQKISKLFSNTAVQLENNGWKLPFTKEERPEVIQAMVSVLETMPQSSLRKVKLQSIVEDGELKVLIESPLVSDFSPGPSDKNKFFESSVYGPSLSDRRPDRLTFIFSFPYPENSRNLEDPVLKRIQTLSSPASPRFENEIRFLERNLDDWAHPYNKLERLQAGLSVPELFDATIKGVLSSRDAHLKEKVLVKALKNLFLKNSTPEEIKAKSVWILTHNDLGTVAKDFVKTYVEENKIEGNILFLHNSLHGRSLNDPSWFLKVEEEPGKFGYRVWLESPKGVWGMLIFTVRAFFSRKGRRAKIEKLFDFLMPTHSHGYISIRAEEAGENWFEWLHNQTITADIDDSDQGTQRLMEALNLILTTVPKELWPRLQIGERLEEKLKGIKSDDNPLNKIRPQESAGPGKSLGKSYSMPARAAILFKPFQVIEESLHVLGLFLSTLSIETTKILINREETDFWGAKTDPETGARRSPEVVLYSYATPWQEFMSGIMTTLWLAGAFGLFIYSPFLLDSFQIWLHSGWPGLLTGLPVTIFSLYMTAGILLMSLFHIIEILGDVFALLNPSSWEFGKPQMTSDFMQAMGSFFTMFLPSKPRVKTSDGEFPFHEYRRYKSPDSGAIKKLRGIFTWLGSFFTSSKSNASENPADWAPDALEFLKQDKPILFPHWYTRLEENLIPLFLTSAVGAEYADNLQTAGVFLSFEDRREDPTSPFIGHDFVDSDRDLTDERNLGDFLSNDGLQAYLSRFDPEAKDKYPGILTRSGPEGFALTLKALDKDTLDQLYRVLGKKEAIPAAQAFYDAGQADQIIIVDSDAQPGLARHMAKEDRKPNFGLDLFLSDLPELKDAHQRRVNYRSLKNVVRYDLILQARAVGQLNDEETDLLDWIIYQFQKGVQMVDKGDYEREPMEEKLYRERTNRYLKRAYFVSKRFGFPTNKRFIKLFSFLNFSRNPLPQVENEITPQQNVPSKFQTTQVKGPGPAGDSSRGNPPARLPEPEQGSSEGTNFLTGSNDGAQAAQNNEASSQFTPAGHDGQGGALQNLLNSVVTSQGEEAPVSSGEGTQVGERESTRGIQTNQFESERAQTDSQRNENNRLQTESLNRNLIQQAEDTNLSLSQRTAQINEIPSFNTQNSEQVSAAKEESQTPPSQTQGLNQKPDTTNSIQNDQNAGALSNLRLSRQDSKPFETDARTLSNILISFGEQLKAVDPSEVLSSLSENQPISALEITNSGETGLAPSTFKDFPQNRSNLRVENSFSLTPGQTFAWAQASALAPPLAPVTSVFSPSDPQTLKSLLVPSFILIETKDQAFQPLDSILLPLNLSAEELDLSNLSGEGSAALVREILSEIQGKTNAGSYIRAYQIWGTPLGTALFSPSQEKQAASQSNDALIKEVFLEGLAEQAFGVQSAGKDPAQILEDIEKSVFDDQFRRFLITQSLSRLKQSLQNQIFGDEDQGDLESANEGTPRPTIQTLEEILEGLSIAALSFGEAFERELTQTDRDDALHPSAQLILLERILIEQGLLPKKESQNAFDQDLNLDEDSLKSSNNKNSGELGKEDNTQSRRPAAREESSISIPSPSLGAIDAGPQETGVALTSDKEAQDTIQNDALNIDGLLLVAKDVITNAGQLSGPALAKALSSVSGFAAGLPPLGGGTLILASGQVLGSISDAFTFSARTAASQTNTLSGNSPSSSGLTPLSEIIRESSDLASPGALGASNVSLLLLLSLSVVDGIRAEIQNEIQRDSTGENSQTPDSRQRDASLETLVSIIISSAKAAQDLQTKRNGLDFSVLRNLLTPLVKLTDEEQTAVNLSFKLDFKDWAALKIKLEKELRALASRPDFSPSEAVSLAQWIAWVGGPVVDIEKAIGGKNPVLPLTSTNPEEAKVEAAHIQEIARRLGRDSTIYLVGTPDQKTFLESAGFSGGEFIPATEGRNPIELTEDGRVLLADILAESLLAHFTGQKTSQLQNLTVVIPAGISVQQLQSSNPFTNVLLQNLHWVLNDLLFGLPLNTSQLDHIQELSEILIHA